jgi:type I restriction enzyme, S subunit
MICPDSQSVVIADVATFASGRTPSRSRQSDYFDGGTVHWVKTLDLNNGAITRTDESVTTLALADTGMAVLPPGTVLVAMYGGFNQIGRTGVLRVNAVTNQAITAVLPINRCLDSDYLLHLLNYKVGYWRTVASSSRKDPNITKDDVCRFPMSLPPLSVQRRIADSLNDADSTIEKLERLIAKKCAIKQGIMQQLLTGRIRLPGFTDQWSEVRLGDHVNYVKTVALSRAQLDSKSPLKYLHYGDIHTRSSVLLDTASEEMPRAGASLAVQAGLLQRGDLVFADASEDPAGVGKSVEIVGVPDTGVVPGLHTIAARFDKSALADGFKAYLQFIPSFRDQLLRLAAGTKVLATTRSYISSITLTLPDVAEQKAIAETLHDSERGIEALRVRLVKAQRIKTGMMQQLLTGRTRLPEEALA